MSSEASRPIPRFAFPEALDIDELQTLHIFSSPDDGEIVQIYDNLWHAEHIEEWMRADGERLSLSDFERAATDTGLSLAMANRAFDLALYPAFNEAVVAGLAIINANPGAYAFNPYKAYSFWLNNPERRAQLLVSTQLTFGIYQALNNTDRYRKKPPQFLRTLDTFSRQNHQMTSQPTDTWSSEAYA